MTALEIACSLMTNHLADDRARANWSLTASLLGQRVDGYFYDCLAALVRTVPGLWIERESLGRSTTGAVIGVTDNRDATRYDELIDSLVKHLPVTFVCAERPKGLRAHLHVTLDKQTRREVVAMFPLFYAAVAAR